jgi:RNA polymerase sigma factor (sigma-70 family)
MPVEKPAAGFEETYREQRLAMLRLAYLLCGSRETSEDVVQSAFASAHPRWEQIECPVQYLRRSVVNLVKDGQRRRFRMTSLMLSSWPEAISLPPEVDETWVLVQRLPWNQRAVVVLHYYEDLPLVEIAQVLRRSAPTVRSDHRRALDRLRKAMQ